ncbi:MAG: FAD-binding oxidoreductase, partial [Hyphomicrobiaceae bacterium]
VLRTDPIANGPEAALWESNFGLRKRLDGGYSVANGSSSLVDIVPDSFRFCFQFLPNLQHEWKALRFRLGSRFAAEWQEKSQLAPDKTTIFERVRVLDPAPETALSEAALAQVMAVFPALRGATIAQHWAGLIDVTPDVVPVIGPVPSLPGFYLASGFSGHGFGIGPAAGRLMADIISGDTPIADPKPLRFERFSDGSPIIVN